MHACMYVCTCVCVRMEGPRTELNDLGEVVLGLEDLAALVAELRVHGVHLVEEGLQHAHVPDGMGEYGTRGGGGAAGVSRSIS
jgi:hypothetical protein